MTLCGKIVQSYKCDASQKYERMDQAKRFVHTVMTTKIESLSIFSSKNGLHWSLKKCSHGDLRQWQWQQRCHQIGFKLNCDGNGNNTKIKMSLTSQCEWILRGHSHLTTMM